MTPCLKGERAGSDMEYRNKAASARELREVERGISVVVPAFNEEASVGAEVEAIRQAMSRNGTPFEIIVVDDASTDRTSIVAMGNGARVFRHMENRGYGAAIKTGIRGALYDTIVITDADGTYPADQIPHLIEKLEAADMVVGARIGEEVHIPLIRRPAKWLLRRLAQHIAGQPIPDLNSGLRAFRRQAIEPYFPMLSNRFSFTTTSTLALLGDDFRVVYHTINYYKRIGTSKIRPHHFMDFVILVLRMAMLFQPLKVFVPLAAVSIGIGVMKSIIDVLLVMERVATFGWATFYQPVLSTSALLLFLAGLQFLAIGMVADGVLRRLSYQSKGPGQPQATKVCEVTHAMVEETELKRPDEKL